MRFRNLYYQGIEGCKLKMNRRKIYELTKGKCFYCGCEIDFHNFHADHFFPKSKGGEKGKNLVPSCSECNICKGNLEIEKFREKLSNIPDKTFSGKIMKKYYGIKAKAIKFYFEEISENDGTWNDAGIFVKTEEKYLED